MENEFPPNSHHTKESRRDRSAEKPSERKDVQRVTRSKATIRKKPLRKRFVETFTGDGNKGVMEYVLLDVLVPGFKDIVADASTTAIERTLFGDVSDRGRRRSRGGSGYTSYNRMGSARPRDRRDRDRDRDDDRRERRTGRRSSDIPEIILDTRVEADEVIDSLFELISKYEMATMRDLLSLVGEPHNTTDEDWGWTDLRGARIHKVRDGYLLDLPRPEALD